MVGQEFLLYEGLHLLQQCVARLHGTPPGAPFLRACLHALLRCGAVAVVRGKCGAKHPDIFVIRVDNINTFMSLASVVLSLVLNTSVSVDASQMFYCWPSRELCEQFSHSFGLFLFREVLRRFQATLLLKRVFENLGSLFVRLCRSGTS